MCLSILFNESQHSSLLPPFGSLVLLFSKQELGKEIEAGMDPPQKLSQAWKGQQRSPDRQPVLYACTP